MLNVRSARHKAALIHDVIHDNRLDVLFLTETWIPADAPDAIKLDCAPPGYAALHRHHGLSNGYLSVNSPELFFGLFRVRVKVRIRVRIRVRVGVRVRVNLVTETNIDRKNNSGELTDKYRVLIVVEEEWRSSTVIPSKLRQWTLATTPSLSRCL